MSDNGGIKPCPCGGNMKNSICDNGFLLECENCKKTFPGDLNQMCFMSPEEAIEKWNNS